MDYADDEANGLKKLRSSIETANIKVFELTMKLEEANEGSAFTCIIGMRKEKLGVD